MIDTAVETIRASFNELVNTRHFLHSHPELSDNEENTARFVSEKLSQMGVMHKTGVGGHGVLAELVGKRQGKTIGLRADMDALPILEQNTFDYCSQNKGVMHACGHDGHTTVLLGAAKALQSLNGDFAGTVRMIFQPAEETVGGAARMCAEGAMEGVDAVLALHGWPGIELGAIGIRRGAMMASADTFDITVKGKGSHAAYPHQSFDPIMVGAQIVTALQSIISREINPADPAVVSVTKFHAGTAYNVIPGHAEIAGTIRTLSPDLRKEIPNRIRSIAEGICAAHRAECEFRYHMGTGPVYNDPNFTDLVEDVARETFGDKAVYEVPYASMGAEDFAAYLEYAPGMMFRLGLGDVSPIHTPTFNFDDRALPIGVIPMSIYWWQGADYFKRPTSEERHAQLP